LHRRVRNERISNYRKWKRHDNVLSDIRKQIEYAGKEFAALNFKEGEYLDKNSQPRPKIQLTEEAFTLVVFSYNTKEAVQSKIKFIQEFKKMKEHLSGPRVLSEKEQLMASMKLSLETAEEITAVKEEVKEVRGMVENQITLDHGEQRRIQKAINSKVYETDSDKEIRKKLFSELHREIKDRFAVTSYKDIKRKDMQVAIRYIEGWVPRRVS
jgi:Rha family phage regulatory protein